MVFLFFDLLYIWLARGQARYVIDAYKQTAFFDRKTHFYLENIVN